MRRIVIHAGFGKTGSSAIQLFLANNKDLLDSLGLFYKCPEINNSREITSGNAEPLYEALKNHRISDIHDFLETHTSQEKISILSSEMLAHLKRDQWHTLIKSCETKGLEIEKIVFFVRNVDGFLKSAYDQTLKRHGNSNEFQNFISVDNWQHYNALINLKQVFDQGILLPLHFESKKRELLHAFFSKLVEIPAELEERITSENVVVNRSLTNVERIWLKKLNSKFGDLYSEALSDRFIYENPDLSKDEIFLDDRTLGIIKDRFSHQVNWVNDSFFQGKPIVACISKNLLQKGHSTNSDAATDTVNLVSDFLLAEMENVSLKIRDRILRILHTIQKKNKTIPADFPENFEYLAYLILNPDLANYEIDLEFHYRENGRRENRRYNL